MVLELLSDGADINAKPSHLNRDTPLLTLAVARNHGGAVDVLLAAGAKLGGDRAKSLPLHAAATKGFRGPLEKLLVAAANVNSLDPRGRSALHRACSNNHEDAVEVLLRHGASLTSLCDEDLPPHDVVAVDRLIDAKQLRMLRRSPFTLDAAQTSATNRICGVLKGAGSWVRRDWLVMQRARRQGLAAKVVDVSSSALLSLSARTLREDQTAAPRDVASVADDDTGNDSALAGGRGNSSVSSTSSEVILKHTVPAEGPGHAVRGSSATTLTVDGGGESGQQAGGSCWKGAVEWLTQCPDESGVFREVLSFI